MPSATSPALVNGHVTNESINGHTKNALEVPVLIIGGGPSGLLLSYLLSQLQIESLVIERYSERLAAPKAHALSPRSLEVCRQFGLDVGRIRSLGTRREDASRVNFLTTLSGDVVGGLPYERMDTAVLEATPEMIHNIPQPKFEQLVADRLHVAKNADIRKGVSFVSLEQTAGGVVTTVEERATGHTYTIGSRFVVACDGHRSKVRDFLGIESEGEDSYETMMTIHFAADLRPVVGERVGMLHWLFDPIASGFIIAYDLSDNAVLISNFDADRHPVKTWSEDLCRAVLAGAIGKEISPKILSYRPWILSRKVAKEYRRGNVFLAGDAAHSFPPTGGLGLNSGLGDVHNLAFKLAAFLNGRASSSCLDTYESERRHVAEVNSRQSVKNGKQIFGLLKTLGTAGSSNLQEARKRLFKTIHDPGKQAEIDQAIEMQREHFDNLGLHIGYVYGDNSMPDNASVYTAKFIPGARLPHAWVKFPNGTCPNGLSPVDLSYLYEFNAKDREERQYSSLDLCAYDSFTLLLPSRESSDRDFSAFLKRCQDRDIPVNVYRMADDFIAKSDVWIGKSGLSTGSALVVRPDQHILLSINAATTDDECWMALTSFLDGRSC